MKSLLIVIILCCTRFSAFTQPMYFPPLTGNAWDTISPQSLGWCEDRIDSLVNYLEDRNTRAFILLKDGKIVIEKYFGNFTMDSIWHWASAGKTLTSFLVGMAQQEGYLKITDTTSQYLGQGWTSLPPSQEEKITIRHQLTMTTGLDDLVSDPYCTDDTCLIYKADAGTRWAYHNAPYTLLDDVISSATGTTLNNYLIQKLTNTAGISGLFFPSGYNNVFVSKPRSMARFGLLVLNRGNWDGLQIMTDSTYFSDMVNTSQSLNLSYGYLWWLNGKASYMAPLLQFVFPGSLNQHAPSDMIAALGKDGQIINIVPSQNLVYIRMGNAPSAGQVPITFNDTVWIKLNEIMCISTGVDETMDTDISVYPNPANEYVKIKFPGKKFHVSVFDITGKEIYSMYNNEGKCYISGLMRGVHILNINTGDRFFYRRIIIQ